MPPCRSLPTGSWYWNDAPIPRPVNRGKAGQPASKFAYPVCNPTTNPEALPVRTERHNPQSIATLRRQIATPLTRYLPRCPCCLRRIYNTVVLDADAETGIAHFKPTLHDVVLQSISHILSFLDVDHSGLDLRKDERELDDHSRSAVRTIGCGDLSSVRAGDSVDECQTESVSGRFVPLEPCGCYPVDGVFFFIFIPQPFKSRGNDAILLQ